MLGTHADELGKVIQAYFSSTLRGLKGIALETLQKDLDNLHDVIVDIFKNMAALHKLTESSACIKHPAGECEAKDGTRLVVLEKSSKKCFASKEAALKDVKEACERSERGAQWVESQQGKTKKK
jgi:molybdopterin synthase catalytic subunit